jgi:PBSX family phage terminase large subunit
MGSSPIIFKPHSIKQEEAFYSKKRITICATGIQWGKTSVGVIKLIHEMFKHTAKTDNFLVTSPTYKVLYQSTMPVFMRFCGDFGVPDKKNEAFKLHNGGTVWFRTGQNPDSVVGIQDVRAILADEAGLYTRYFYDNLQARSSVKEAPIIIVTSPYSLNWLYTDYIRPYHNGDEFIRSITMLKQARSNENPYFPPNEYELKQKTMDPRRFNMIYGGAFDKAQGLVYDVFDAKKMIVDQIRLATGTRFFGGIDWGHTDPTVIKIRAVTESGMHYSVDEHLETQMHQEDILEQCARLRALWNVEKFYADPSRPDHISYLNQHGITCIGSVNDIEPGIELHYQLIKTGYYAVFKHSNKHTLDEYETYHYPEPSNLKPDQNQRTRINLPVDQNNHCMDAERYITMNTFSIGKRKNLIVKDSESLVKAEAAHHDRVTRLEKLKRRPKRDADL